jgi:hypothetical protein
MGMNPDVADEEPAPESEPEPEPEPVPFGGHGGFGHHRGGFGHHRGGFGHPVPRGGPPSVRDMKYFFPNYLEKKII